MEDKLVMETGLMDYDYLHKPVKYTDEFLSSLTGNETYDVHNEHYGEKVGEVTQLYYKDNGLYASFNKDFDVGDKGFSTVLSVSELEEHDDCYVPIPGMARIESVDIVSNPKFTATICNSKDIFNKKDNETDEDNRMSSELEDKLLENGALKQKLNVHQGQLLCRLFGKFSLKKSMRILSRSFLITSKFLLPKFLHLWRLRLSC